MINVTSDQDGIPLNLNNTDEAGQSFPYSGQADYR